MDKDKEYSSPIGLTSQFRFCPNAFRIDMYKGCDFGCSYCFSNSNNTHGHSGYAVANIKTIKNIFNKAFETDTKSDDLTIELLRNRVPLHCGGMSDPFQKREFELELTYKLIELTNHCALWRCLWLLQLKKFTVTAMPTERAVRRGIPCFLSTATISWMFSTIASISLILY